MGTLQSLRKAYGALKDSTTVSLAKVNSEYKDLDIAVVKASNHSESPPNERYVREIFDATSVIRPRADVAYCIHALARRLAKTHSWMVAMKTLIVIHRTLREGDPTFKVELLNYSRRANILQISNFKDDSCPLAWDYSAWIRSYALYLEEKLECFRVLKYDVEAERLRKSGSSKGHSRTRDLDCNELLEQLPSLQNLQHRLIGCRPEGAAFYNELIQYALVLVLKESFKLHCAINDGIINLVDMFFEMSRHNAVKAFNIYKIAGQQAERLSDLYEFCKGLDLARNFQFPALRQPPPSFFATMEDYIKEAPLTSSVSNKRMEYEERDLKVMYKAESPSAESVISVEEDKKPSSTDTVEPQPTANDAPKSAPAAETGDLLCLDDENPNAAELDESNALALAIVQPGDDSKSSMTSGLPLSGTNTSGWELALLNTSSSNGSQVVGSELARGFDKLFLNSLYDNAEAMKKQQQQHNMGYGGGMLTLFDPQDSFAMSNNIASPPNVQMTLMAQQQFHQHQQQQQQHHMTPMMMMPQLYQPHHHHPQVGGTNPFADP